MPNLYIEDRGVFLQHVNSYGDVLYLLDFNFTLQVQLVTQCHFAFHIYVYRQNYHILLNDYRQANASFIPFELYS